MDKKVMIVDDEQDILFSLRTLFERQGYEVITVDSGAKCVNELEKGFSGVVLMDIMMPKMDGWDTIREIVKNGLENNVKIVVITARGTHHQEKMQGLEPFILDYVSKPFDLNKLLSIVNNLNY